MAEPAHGTAPFLRCTAARADRHLRSPYSPSNTPARNASKKPGKIRRKRIGTSPESDGVIAPSQNNRSQDFVDRTPHRSLIRTATDMERCLFFIRTATVREWPGLLSQPRQILSGLGERASPPVGTSGSERPQCAFSAARSRTILLSVRILAQHASGSPAGRRPSIRGLGVPPCRRTVTRADRLRLAGPECIRRDRRRAGCGPTQTR